MKQKKTFTAYFMVHGAVIAAIYVVLTILFAPISFGPVQFRISEALCVLPYFTPAAVPGVFRYGRGAGKPGDSDRSNWILCS